MATTAPTVRSLDQILAELGTVYNPQVKNIQTRMAQLPGQIQAEEKGLAAKQESAFGDILSGARRRGTGVAFGGIPLGEQAKYTSTEYMPALARLKQSGREQVMSLEDAINQIRTEQRSAAMAQQQYEQQRRDAYNSEQRTLAQNAQQKSVADYLAGIMNQQNQGNQQTTKSILDNRGVERSGNGFNFFDTNGKPITAGQFAQKNNLDIRDVLYEMGQTDLGAAELYNKLRRVGDNNLLSTIGQLSPQYMHILGGYNIPSIFKSAANTKAPSNTKTTNNSFVSNLNSSVPTIGGYR